MFSLVRFFSITGVIAFVIVTALLTVFLGKLVRDDLLELEGINNVARTQEFLSSTWPGSDAFGNSMSKLGGEQRLAHPEIARIRGAVLARMSGSSVVKVKIYDLEGLTVFSTEPDQIGDDASGNSGFVAARSGQVVNQLTHRGEFNSFDGVIEEVDVISSYVPIRNNTQTQTVEGVLELYSDVTPFINRMDNTQTAIVAAVLLALSALFTVLFFAVRLADRIAHTQDAARQRAEVAFEAAREADQAKLEFLSRTSHELRTPMNSILGFGQLLETDEAQSLSERQQEYVAHILSAGRHLLALIDEVLDLAQIESGRMRLSMQQIDPVKVLDDCTRLVHPFAETHRVTVDIERPAKTIPRVYADGTRLKQVLLNLMSNAVKYNRLGGRVTVRCYELDDKVVGISVADTGPGIPESRLGELFEPFARLGAERGSVQGVGIGLGITKRLVELMGGELRVQSTLGQGSKFSVELSRELGTEMQVENDEGLPPTFQPSVQPESRTSQILCIEDDPASLAMMRAALLREPGTVVLAAPNAELGLELARSKRPDIILMDVNLPGMNGIDALMVLKSDENTCKIPVIAVSAGAMPKDVERGRAARFFEYLTKPVDLDRLSQTLARARLESSSTGAKAS